MIVSRYVCLFIIYSFMGWIYESIFCTVKGGKWENRGFMYGPVCPIYGTGAAAISLVVHFAGDRNYVPAVWQLFVIGVVGSAVLEFVTSWVLEKLFHARWWDYSNWPLNWNGRISLFSSLGFGAASLLVVYVIAPFTENAVDHVSPIATEVLALCFLAVFVSDLTLTVSALYHFEQVVIRFEDSFNSSMDTLVENTVQKTNQIRQGIGTGQKIVYDRLKLMGGGVKAAVQRIYIFRDEDKQKENVRNSILSFIRKRLDMKEIEAETDEER